MQQSEEQVKTKLQTYHFPGGLKYKPVSIEAVSPEEANAKYEAMRETLKNPEA